MNQVASKCAVKVGEVAIYAAVAVVTAGIGWLAYGYMQYRKEKKDSKCKAVRVTSPAVEKEVVAVV